MADIRMDECIGVGFGDSCVVWQIRNLYLSRNALYLLSPRLCWFIVLKRDLFVYRDDSLTS